MSKKLDLAALLSNPDAPVSKSDTTIVEIKMDLIDGNEGNFYNVGNVDDLAESIQLVGLQQPLVVRRNGERFTLIAGHRRRKALQQLGRETAPCIITEDTGTGDDAFAALRLIMTNSTARELSHYERSQQVRKVEAELVKLSGQGIKLPGKMRDRVAELTKESAAEVARMKVINDKLSKVWKGKYAKGQISGSVAYEIAKLDEAKQVRLKKAFGGNYSKLEAKAAKAAAVNYEYDWVKDICPIQDTWHLDMCSRVKERAAYKSRHSECGGCCNECESAKDCSMCCDKVSKKLKAKQESEERRRQSEAADEVFEKSSFAQMQRRFIEVLAEHGVTTMTQLKDASGLEYYQLGGALQCNRNITKLSLETYCKIADNLGISLSQLLGLDAVPAATEPLKWRGIGWDNPTHDMEVIVMFRTKFGGPHLRQALFEKGEFYMPLDRDADGDKVTLPKTFTHWAPMPEDEDS